MKKLIAVTAAVLIMFLLVGCGPKNSTDPTAADTPTIPLLWGVRYMYCVDEGRFSSYVRGEAIAESKIGEKLETVFVTVGLRNNDEKFWLSRQTRRGEVYSIQGISEDVAVALKFIDEGEGATTTHYYVIMNPEADLTAVEAYKVSPYRVGNFLSQGTGIYPTVMVNGQLYKWKTTCGYELPENSVYFGELTYVYAQMPVKDCEFMSVFMVSGEIYTVPDDQGRVYLCLTTELTPQWLNKTIVAFDLAQAG